MKIIITGSLGNIGKPLAQSLIASGHDITIVSSSAHRKSDIENLGAKAAIGSVTDADFLAHTFAGADSIFAMTPPNLGGSNIILNTAAAGNAFAAAIKKAGVKRVVMLSSIGAQLENGTGPITGLHQIEKIYGTLQDTALTFLRAGFFFTNLYNDIAMIKGAGIMGANYPASLKMPFVHPGDIAAAAAEELQKETTGKNIRYIISDVRTPAEVASALGTAIGKDLPWIEFTDEQSLQGMMQAGLTEEIAGLYTEMGSGLRSGKISEHFIGNNFSVDGKIKLEDFAKEFADKFGLN